MAPEETRFFRLLDAYSRSKRGYFLAEMTARGGEYVSCLRPNAQSKDSASRYSCRYVRVPNADVFGSDEQGLGETLKNKLDHELATLNEID